MRPFMNLIAGTLLALLPATSMAQYAMTCTNTNEQRTVWPQSTFGGLSASCPINTAMVGGGHMMYTARNFIGPPPYPRASAPKGSWYVEAVNSNTAVSFVFTSTAKCCASTPMLSCGSWLTWAYVPANATSTVTVACAAGYVATAGGYSLESPDNRIVSSKPLDNDKWAIVVRNTSASQREVYAAVQCCNMPSLSPRLECITVSANATRVGSGLSNVEMRCPVDYTLTGVGFGTNESTAAIVPYFLTTRWDSVGWTEFSAAGIPSNYMYYTDVSARCCRLAP